eukprot:m.350399 g.350399  ORF g.350399 m.350399 type:complete len:513 (-) comp47239_c0_seq1:382-1920(-)
MCFNGKCTGIASSMCSKQEVSARNPDASVCKEWCSSAGFANFSTNTDICECHEDYDFIDCSCKGKDFEGECYPKCNVTIFYPPKPGFYAMKDAECIAGYHKFCPQPGQLFPYHWSDAREEFRQYLGIVGSQEWMLCPCNERSTCDIDISLKTLLPQCQNDSIITNITVYNNKTERRELYNATLKQVFSNVKCGNCGPLDFRRMTDYSGLGGGLDQYLKKRFLNIFHDVVGNPNTFARGEDKRPEQVPVAKEQLCARRRTTCRGTYSVRYYEGDFYHDLCCMDLSGRREPSCSDINISSTTSTTTSKTLTTDTRSTSFTSRTSRTTETSTITVLGRSCGKGQFVDKANKINCSECPPGQYQPQQGYDGTFCYFQSNTTQEQCELAGGVFTEGNASTKSTCTPTDGKYISSYLQSTGEECPYDGSGLEGLCYYEDEYLRLLSDDKTRVANRINDWINWLNSFDCCQTQTLQTLASEHFELYRQQHKCYRFQSDALYFGPSTKLMFEAANPTFNS